MEILNVMIFKMSYQLGDVIIAELVSVADLITVVLHALVIHVELVVVVIPVEVVVDVMPVEVDVELILVG